MISEKVKRIAYAAEDWFFDLRNNVQTRGVIAADNVQANGHAEAKPHATAYQAVWCRNLRVLIRSAMRAGGPKTFIDIGAGKGKACIYASRHFPEVIGVEYAEDLLAAAQNNLQKSGKSNIRLVMADAAYYDIPDRQSLIFLFNPFDAVILKKFIARNLARIQSHGSLIAYANDVQRGVLEESGFECVFRDEFRKLSLWRR